MTNKNLHVLCLFVITMGTFINGIKCVTREDCRTEIFRTNHMIARLTDSNAYSLIINTIKEFLYDGIIEFLFPPDSLLLIGKDENDSIYSTIKQNELAIQRKISEITEATPRINLVGVTSYDDEVELRGEILNKKFRMALGEKRKRIKMCANGERFKCVLVGLIKRTVEFRIKNQPKCNDNNDGTCCITPTEWILTPGVLDQPPIPPKEFYRDRLCVASSPYYETMLFDQARGLVEWYCDIPPRIGEQDSDDE
ncbi:uncharacterized protein LOC126846746 isoform X2 [Adelges cooleyi]|nr:uncharacterized protein LOC126846746 isoform X2 [Adelges cooleyi]